MFIFKSCQLVDRVEKLLLNTRLFVEELCGDGLLHDRIHPCRAAVPVGYRVADWLVIFVKKDVINAPGVDADRLRDLPERFQGLEAAQDSTPEVVHVPAVVPVLMDLLVVEPENLLKNDLSVLHTAQDMAARGCADIDGEVILLHLVSLLSVFPFVSLLYQ